MSLGNVGHHISVFHIDGTDSKKVPHIVNTCLAFIHGSLGSRDKFYIREKACQIFSLEQIKAAREILYTTLDPQTKYSYYGPRSKSATDRDKIFDAYEGIYSKMMKIDAENSTPVFSVPSVELNGLIYLMDPPHDSHQSCESKLKKMDDRISELHATFNNYVNIATSNNPPPTFAPRKVSKGIPPSTRNRLLSNASKRSASELSEDEGSVPEDDNGSDNDDAFVLPKKQQKKKIRRNSNNIASKPKIDTEKDSKSLKNPVLYSQMAKLPATKGTVKSSAAFRAAVPDVFLFNCHVKCNESDVKEFFTPYNIKINKVEKKSHALSARSSFKLSPETKEDYDKILNAEFLPDEICARKYIFRRGRVNTERKEQFVRNGPSQAMNGELSSATSRLLEELASLDPTRNSPVEGMDVSERKENTTNIEDGGSSK